MQPHTLRLQGGEPLAATPRCTFPVGFMRSCGYICVCLPVCLCGCVSCRGQHLFPCPPLKRSCDSRVFVAAQHESWQFGFKGPSFPFSILVPISPACCTYLCSGIANTHACTPRKLGICSLSESITMFRNKQINCAYCIQVLKIF